MSSIYKTSNHTNNSSIESHNNTQISIFKYIYSQNDTIYKINELIKFNKQYSWSNSFKYIYKYDNENNLNYLIDNFILNKPLKG